ncbi:MAG: 30S ribosomal protein S16 [Anaerolineae bacterium]
MVRIRLRRVGLKKQPSYRIIVADQRSPRNGDFIEAIGNHNPRTEPITDVVDEARALHWLSVGAQPSEAVAYIFKRTGTFARYERLKKGEALEALVAEAQAAAANAPKSTKTRRPSPGPGEGTMKKQASGS